MGTAWAEGGVQQREAGWSQRSRCCTTANWASSCFRVSAAAASRRSLASSSSSSEPATDDSAVPALEAGADEVRL